MMNGDSFIWMGQLEIFKEGSKVLALPSMAKSKQCQNMVVSMIGMVGMPKYVKW